MTISAQCRSVVAKTCTKESIQHYTKTWQKCGFTEDGYC